MSFISLVFAGKEFLFSVLIDVNTISIDLPFYLTWKDSNQRKRRGKNSSYLVFFLFNLQVTLTFHLVRHNRKILKHVEFAVIDISDDRNKYT